MAWGVTSAAAWPAGAARVSLPGSIARWLETERPQWFLWLPVALGCGIGAYFSLPFEPALLQALAPLAVALLLWLFVRRGGVAAFVLGLVMAASLGFALAKVRSDRVAAPVLERRMGPVEVRGRIELVELRVTRGERLTLRVASIEGVPAERTPRRVRIRAMQASEGLGPGDAVRIRAHLAPPSGPALPGGYDFARGSYFQRLGGIGYALTRAEPDLDALPPPAGLADAGFAWTAAVSRLRQDITRRVTAALAGQTGAIAAALISGERGGISEKTNDAFRDSGLYHMLSISGLHMAIMGGSVFFVVRLLLALVPSIALRYPVKKWAAAAAIVAALAYLVISGAAFATVRSAVTIVVMFLAILIDRPAIAMRNVALSALLILVVWPESLTDVGFQMSFAAVAALVACYEAVRRRILAGSRWPEGAPARFVLFFAGIVLSTLIASLAVAPFGAYYFHKGQQLAIIANVVATPICNLAIMPAALAALVAMPVGLEAAPLAVMGVGIDATIRTAEWVAALPGASVRIPAIPQAAFLLMIGGGIWIVLWQQRARWLGLVPLLLGMAVAPLAPRPDILVGHDGRLVAVRTGDGALAALAAPQTAFELARWLEHDGDARSVKAVTAAPGFRCDDSGCTARVAGLSVAAPRHPAALADDCLRADILLLDVPRPKACAKPRLVIDVFDLKARGTHAVYIERPSDSATPGTAAGGSNGGVGRNRAMVSERDADPSPREPPAPTSAAGGLRVATVAGVRGDRPWSRLPWWAAGGQRDGGGRGREADLVGGDGGAGPSGLGRRSRLWGFAASPAFIASRLSAAPAVGLDATVSDPSLYDERW